METKINRSFIFNTAWQEVLMDYPPEVRLEVYDAIITYAASGTLPELKPLAKMAFSFIKKEMDCNNRKELSKRESPLKTSRHNAILKPDFVSPEFTDAFSTWLEYKRERKESYKSEKSLKAAYSKLLKLSGNNPCIASEIVEQSMANNWAGLFELKTEHNGNQNRKSYLNKQDANAYAFELLMQHKQELESGMAGEMEKPF